MNKIISIILISVSATAFSQVRIGKSDAANLSSTSVLLEFGDTKDKGIVLPYVETVPAEGSTQATGGTIIFDVSANTEYKIKVKNQNAGWRDLSVQSGYSTSVETIVKPVQATPLADNTNAKAIIGSSTSAADGILVLESTDKAMVLPIVDDYKAIKNPSPGMLAFLKGLTANEHRLIVFNGQKWTFWRPKVN
ncbi:hypothetical protein ACFOWU_12800 [Epilithonimonas zeae]|uniref:Uncharacterized protein n=1 Tax=Epilithonimonas zeae TaxID=1416779 RepID=A0A1N6IZS9_9FLAO|nr:hypothetical protein [Epilithonimonas zeae]SIO37501.1 hypothetical protein SAMN05444409_3165 [Epilithonimonas zeae]